MYRLMGASADGQERRGTTPGEAWKWRLIVGIPLTIAVALFALLGLGLMLAWVASHRQPGLFLGALAHGGAALMAWDLQSWWPLVTGFAVAWCLRLLGRDPGYRSGSPQVGQHGGASQPVGSPATGEGCPPVSGGNGLAVVAQVGAQQTSVLAPRRRGLRTLGTIGCALLGVAAGFGVPDFGHRWENNSAPEAGFSVECPGVLQPRVEAEVSAGPLGEAHPRVRAYVLVGERRWRGLFRGSRAAELLSAPTYQVLVMDLPAAVVGAAPDRIAASFIDGGLVAGAKKDRAILTDGTPAYRAASTQDGQRLAIQVSADREHAYVLSALNANAEDSNRFFASLRLLRR